MREVFCSNLQVKCAHFRFDLERVMSSRRFTNAKVVTTLYLFTCKSDIASDVEGSNAD